jgi:hypothetical protein
MNYSLPSFSFVDVSRLLAAEGELKTDASDGGENVYQEEGGKSTGTLKHQRTAGGARFGGLESGLTLFLHDF